MTYIDIHKRILEGLTELQFREKMEESRAVFSHHYVKTLGTYCDPQRGRCFCVTEAIKPEAVEEAHKAAGMHCDEIYELVTFLQKAKEIS